MANRPVALPEIYTGEGNQHWSDWTDHFERVAEVNEWNAAARNSGFKHS